MGGYDPTDTRAQERAQADAETRVRLAEETEDADFEWLMHSRRGRRIVWRLLDRAGVFRLSFSTDALAMAFAEGGRNEGLRILSRIHACCPELYHVMAEEQTRDDGDADDGHDADS